VEIADSAAATASVVLRSSTPSIKSISDSFPVKNTTNKKYNLNLKHKYIKYLNPYTQITNISSPLKKIITTKE